MVKIGSLLVSMVFSGQLWSYTKNDPHLPINHCYHWLDEAGSGYLTYKYNYAAKNRGDFSFYTTGGNGAVAGPGIYCAKSPSGSYTYGDRVIRIDFVSDLVIFDEPNNRKICLDHAANCSQKAWDVKFYSGGGKGNYAWYVISGPQAIASWSATSPQLIQDLKASKALNPGTLATHIDNTLTAMQKDKHGIFRNQKSRMNIKTLLANPKALKQIPPLTVVNQVLQAPAGLLTAAEKTQAYHQQIQRAFRDTKLGFEDFEALNKKNKQIQQAFIDELSNIDLNQLDKLNPVIFILGADKYIPTNKIPNDYAVKLWEAAFKSLGSLASITKTKLKANGAFALNFENGLPGINRILSRVQPHNLTYLLTLMDTYLSDGTKIDTLEYTSSIMQKVLQIDPSHVPFVYKLIKNPVMQKQKALVKLFTHLSSKSFVGYDPLYLGNLFDFVASTLSASQKNSFVQQLLQLPLPVSKKPTYLVLDDFINGKFKLPSFMNLNIFFDLLIRRSIEERSAIAKNTNTFRFIFSDLFHYFYKPIKTAKSKPQKIQLAKPAFQYYINLAKKLAYSKLYPGMPDVSDSYAYTALQNASLFNSHLNYKEHPIESAYANYRQGQTQYDLFFERVAQKSMDGSFWDFVIKRLIDDDKQITTGSLTPANSKATSLFHGMVNHLLSQKFDSYLKSKEFKIVNEEKKHWKNVIRPQGAKKSQWLKSDLCYVSNIIYAHRNFLDDYFKRQHMTAQYGQLVGKEKAIYKHLCQ